MLDNLKAFGLIALMAGAGPAFAQAPPVGPSAPVPDDTNPDPGPVPDDDIVEVGSATAEAEAEAEGEKFPIGASISLSHSFAHSEFVETDQDWDSSGQFLGLDVGLSYQAFDELSFTAGIGVIKAVDTGYLSGEGGSGLSNYETNLTDLTLGGKWSFFTVPVADIKLGVSGGVRLPTGKVSIAQGLIVGLSGGLSLSRKFFDALSVSVSGGYTHNVWEDPTQQIDPRFVDLLRISGPDLGEPLPLSGWSATLSLGYSIIEPLSLSVTYQLSGRTSSIIGPDDEYTAEVAQTGVQYSTGAHSFAVGLSYELPFDTGTSIGAQMATALKLYNIDGSGDVTQPFFDTYSRQGAYTGYTLSVTQAL